MKSSPWKEGKGDVVKEFTDACRKLGMGCGLYYSPADFSARTGEKSGKEFEDYFIAQISELLSDYGKIDYLWFDGCGAEKLTFDRARIVKAIRNLQPEILIFNMWDPDVRWVGNEEGFAPQNNSNLVNFVNFSVLTDKKEELSGKAFLPAECDMRMRKTHWFTADDSELHTVKSLEKLTEIYDASVGHGANLLLNIGPASNGLLPPADKARLLELGEKIRERFAHPKKAEITKDANTFTLLFDKKEEVNLAVISEDLLEGENVLSFELFCDEEKVFEGFTVGHKAICKFDTVSAEKLTLKITASRNEAKILNFTAFFEKR